MRTKNKWQGFTGVILVFVFAFSMFAGNLVYADTTTNLTDRLSDLKINIWSYENGEVKDQIIQDNHLVNDNQHIVKAGKQYSFKLAWNLSEDAMQQQPAVKEGDYFYIDIGSDHSFKPLTVDSTKLMHGTEHLADWEMKDGRIKCTLTAKGAGKAYLSGGFEGFISWASLGGDNIQITINGEPIDQIPAQETQGGGTDPENKDYPYHSHAVSRPDEFLKSGIYQNYNGMITWRINFGKQSYYDITKGGSVQQKKNVFIEDTLSQGQEINLAQVQYTIYHPSDEDGTPSSYYGIMSAVPDSMITRLEKTAGESEADFRNRVKNHTTPAYGYSDTSVYVNLGDYPNESLKYPSDAQLTQALKAKNFTDKEIETILKNYGENGPEQGKILLFEIVIQTKATAPSKNGDNKYTNKAILHYDDKTQESNEVEVIALNASGNILAGEKGSATLQKSDKEDSSVLLEGASFYLEKLENGNWEKYTPEDGGSVERQTGQDGLLRFEKLSSGTYRFVESEASHGYSKGSLEMDFDTFDINLQSDTFGKVVLATNKKLMGKTELTKYKSGTADALQDAKFIFYNSNGEFLKIENNVYTWVSDKTEAHQFVTGQDGKIAVDNLPVGTYFFQEIEAPKGFEKDETPCEIKIGVSEQNTIEPVEVAFYNREITEGNISDEQPVQAEPDGNPVTGDRTHTLLFMLAGLASLAAVFTLLVIREKRQKNRNR